jgi:hypothetical protein
VSPPVPAFLAHLPRCPRTGLPYPFSGVDPATGQGRFGVNDLLAKLICGQRRLCGVCGEPLPAEFTFLAADHGQVLRRPVFRDPPSCERCVQASMRLCPHIRRPAEPGWLAWTTSSYELVPDATVLAFRPGPATDVRRFAYRDGRLIVRRAGGPRDA